MNTITQAGETIRTKATEVRDQVTDGVQQSRDQLEIHIHRYPMESVLIAAGSGLLLGVVLGFVLGHRSD